MSRRALEGIKNGLVSTIGSGVANQVLHGRDYDRIQELIPSGNQLPSSRFNTTPLITSQQLGVYGNRLQRFTGPSGTINWAAAMQAGAITPDMQATLQNAGIWDQIQNEISNPSIQMIGDARYQDAGNKYAADVENQQRAEGVAADVKAGMEDVRGQLDQASQDVDTDFKNLTARADATQAQANAVAGQVQKNNVAEAAAFATYQASQMKELQNIITGGLTTIAGEKAEALTSISENMAADVSAATESSRQNMQNQLAAIESNQEMSPEAKAGVGAQVRIATAQQAQKDVAPIRRMYRELETTTRNHFGGLIANFAASGTAAVATLSGQQQAARGSLSATHSEQYAKSLELAAKVGEGLTNIMASAGASKALSQANLASTRVQLESVGGNLSLSLLPYETTPFFDTSEIMDSIYSDQIAQGTLVYNEAAANFQMNVSELSLEMGGQAALQPAFLPEVQQPKPDSSAAWIGAGGDVAGAAITAKIAATVCVDADAWVFTGRGAMTLRDVRLGDYVLAADGNMRKVLRKDCGAPWPERYKDFVEISFGVFSLVCTKDHIVNGIPAGKWISAIPVPAVESGDLLLEGHVPYSVNGVFLVSPMFKE